MQTPPTQVPMREDWDCALLGRIAPDDLVGDIERIIRGAVLPYVDDSNVLLHEDELNAECRAKLALVIDGGHLLKCPTRAKAFAFIKTAMRNHVRSLVEKLAFAQRRTGIKHPPKQCRKEGQASTPRKVAKVSLDDGECSLHIGSADPAFRRLEFLEELDFRLTQEERLVFSGMVAGGDEDGEPRMQIVAARIVQKARAVIAGAPCGRILDELNLGQEPDARMFNTNKVRSAIKSGDTLALEEMFKEGLKANEVLKQGWTLLHLAAKSGHSKVVALLLERGAKVDVQTEMRQTPLDVAVGTPVAEILKEHEAKRAAELSLHAAVMAGDVKWVKKHLAAGVDINAKDRGELPLCLALARHQSEAATLLLKKGADVNKPQQNGEMALHEAAHAGADNSMLKAILDSGADVNAIGYGNMTALCWAAHAGHEDTLKFLIENGADAGYRAKDGTSPASEAINERHYDLGRYLIDKGGKCSFHQAVQCNHLGKARELLSAGADVNERDDSWVDPPMGVAIWNDSVEMVQLLLEYKANPNEQDEIRQGSEGPFGGDTPLHDAVIKGSVKMVKLLLAHGADPDIQNAERLSPIELAKRRDQTHLVSLMEKQIDRAVLGESVDQLYTVNKVAELLSVEEAFVTKLLREGKLRQVKLDENLTRIPASSLKKYLAQLMK
jgi:excisionase family DNA binding protein